MFTTFAHVLAPHVRPNGNVGSAVLDNNLTIGEANKLAANFPGARVVPVQVDVTDGAKLDAISDAILDANAREGFVLPAPVPVRIGIVIPNF